MSDTRRVRVRDYHIVASAGGRPQLLYDMERTQVFSLAAAGSIDGGGELAACLNANDVATCSPAPAPFVATAALTVTHVSLDTAGVCNMGCRYCFEADIGARRGPMSSRVLEQTIAMMFDNAGDGGLVFHFASGEPLAAFPVLAEAVRKIEDKSRAFAVPVSFTVTTNATLISPEIASFLVDHAFKVQVSLDGPPATHNKNRPMLGGQDSYKRVSYGLGLLSERLPRADLTVNTVISPEASLATLWSWAKTLPVGIWITIPVGARSQRVAESDLKRRQFDLECMVDEIATAYEAGREIVEYQPLTKVLRKLATPAPAVRYCGAGASFVGVRADGQVYPCLRQLGLDAHLIGDVSAGLDDSARAKYLSGIAIPVDRRAGCASCWARYLCGGGCYADSVVYGDDPAAPLDAHCAFFRLDIEAAIRLFDRLRCSAPLAIIDLFGKEARSSFDDRMSYLNF